MDRLFLKGSRAHLDVIGHTNSKVGVLNEKEF